MKWVPKELHQDACAASSAGRSGGGRGGRPLLMQTGACKWLRHGRGGTHGRSAGADLGEIPSSAGAPSENGCQRYPLQKRS